MQNVKIPLVCAVILICAALLLTQIGTGSLDEVTGEFTFKAKKASSKELLAKSYTTKNNQKSALNKRVKSFIEKKSPRISKELPKTTSKENYITHVFYLDPTTFELEAIYQSPSAHAINAQKPFPEGAAKNRNTFQVEVGDHLFEKQLIYTEEIIFESENKDGSWANEVDYKSLDQIEVRINIPKGLVKSGQKIKTKIIDKKQGAIIKEKEIFIHDIFREVSANEVKVFFPSDKKEKVKATGKIIEGTPEVYTGGKAIFTSLCPHLREVYPGHNSVSEGRIDLVFVGSGYEFNEEGDPEFKEYLPDLLDLNGEGRHSKGGLFSEEPFASNKDLFNLWYTRTPAKIEFHSEDYCPFVISTACTVPAPSLHQVGLINDECGFSYASLGGNSAVVEFPLPESTDDTSLENIRTAIHEIGHMIGGIGDEYTKESGSSVPNVNCVESEERAELLGWDSGIWAQGCSYVEENIRPTEYSIMRSARNGEDFDYLNEKYICGRLAALTGRLDISCLGDEQDNNSPVAKAGGPYELSENTPRYIHLDFRESYDLDGHPITYRFWIKPVSGEDINLFESEAISAESGKFAYFHEWRYPPGSKVVLEVEDIFGAKHYDSAILPGGTAL